MIATAVDWSKLLGVAVRGLGASIALSLLYAIAVLSTTRAAELRARARAVWVAHAGVGILAGGGCAAAVVWGVVLLSQK